MYRVENVLSDNAKSAEKTFLYIAPENQNKLRYIISRVIWIFLCYSTLPPIVWCLPLATNNKKNRKKNFNRKFPDKEQLKNVYIISVFFFHFTGDILCKKYGTICWNIWCILLFCMCIGCCWTNIVIFVSK